MASTIKHICVICKNLFTGFGHNPDPISTKGRCCDECNNIVILTRLLKTIKKLWFQLKTK